MVYDCFTFFNELDLLEIRLNVLKDVVDKFVLVEAGETHTGKQKPFYYQENRSRFAAFDEKIIYVKVDRFPGKHDAWWNENYQRNAIMDGLKDARPDDRVLISDLDEIPDPASVAKYSKLPGVYDFREVSYALYLNMRDYRTPYTVATRMLPYRDLVSGFDGVEVSYDEFLPADINQGTTVTKVRRRSFPKGQKKLIGAGWHFTCLGGAKAVLDKMRAVAPHLGFDPDDQTLTEEKVADLLVRGQGPGLKLNCFAVPFDGRFPRYILDNRERYAHLIFPVTPEYMRMTCGPRLFRWLQGRLKYAAEIVLMATGVHYQLHRLKVWLAKR